MVDATARALRVGISRRLSYVNNALEDGIIRYQAATIAGLAGSLAMDLVQDGFAAIFERGRAADDRDEETEAIVAVVERISPYVPGKIAERHPGIVGRIIHYVFGSAFAIAYAAARARAPRIAAGRGLAFGTGLWLLSDVVLIPAARFGRSWFRYSRAERANAVLSHLAFALVVEAVLRYEDEAL